MIFRCGITGSGRKASCRNGSASVQPIAAHGGAQAMQLVLDLLEAAVAHQAGDRQRQFGPSPAVRRPTTKPPWSAISRLTAAAMSASSAPTTQMLWLSWPTDGGDGAALQAEALDEAAPDVAGWCRAGSSTATLRMSACRVGVDARRRAYGSSTVRCSVRILPGIDADHRPRRTARTARGRSSGVTGSQLHASRVRPAPRSAAPSKALGPTSRPPRDHRADPAVAQIVQQHDVGAQAGRDQAAVGQPEAVAPPTSVAAR